MREFDDTANPSVDTEQLRSVVVGEPITVAVLYGSHARGEADDSSDIDLAIGFAEQLDSTEQTRVQLRLIERLSTELGTDAVDVVPLDQIQPSLKRMIAEEGIVIYGDPDAVPTATDTDSTREEAMETFDELLADIERVIEQ